MTSEQIWQRSDILGTQVITRTTGKRLGVVSELWVDIDRREIVALGLRENLLARVIPGIPQYMLLSSIRQIGDVILVEDETVIEDVNVEPYSTLINSEVITETGELLGRVRGFRFDIEDGKVTALIIASLGLPLIPDQVVSTYELPIDEIVSSGPDRLIVFEGSEERLIQLTVGVLERLGIGRPPWEREEEEEYMIPTRTENQLGTGTRITTATPIRTATPVVEETWDEDNWGEPELEPMRPTIRQQPLRQRQPEPVYYEEDNWSEATAKDAYEYEDEYEEEELYKEPDYVDEYEDAIEEDVWADQEPRSYKAPRVNIPEKTKAPEYEEEGY